VPEDEQAESTPTHDPGIASGNIQCRSLRSQNTTTRIARHFADPPACIASPPSCPFLSDATRDFLHRSTLPQKKLVKWLPRTFPDPGRRNNRRPIPTPRCAASCANGRKSWRSNTANSIELTITTGRRRSSRISSSAAREKVAAAALDKLARAFGPGVTLEGLRLDGDYPMAVWSILRPRESVTAGATAESGLAQNCVTVNCLLAGRLPSWAGPGIPGPTISGLAEGLWSLEVPDHALGRAIERSGRLPDAIIAEAHHNILHLRQNQLKQTEVTVMPVAASDGLRMSLGSQFLVRAGDGGFVCELTLGPEVGTDDDPAVMITAFPGRELSIQARAATWIAEDMVHERQVLLAEDGLSGERLGDGWLLPQLLRQLSMVQSVDGGMSINFRSWEPGLPELLTRRARRVRDS
jgi:hypothetical protein